MTGMVSAPPSLLVATAWAVGLGFLFLAVSALFRFGLGWTSAARTRPLARFTRGYRIHHGYPGVLLLLVLPWVPTTSWYFLALWTGGWALILSDVLHHLLLWWVTGDPELHGRYPPRSDDC